MTYKEYIDKLNKLYARRHQHLFTLVETENAGTFPIYEDHWADDGGEGIEYIDVAEEVERLDHEIYYLVSAASEEPWYQTHVRRHLDTVSILNYDAPIGVVKEKPRHDFKGFNF